MSKAVYFDTSFLMSYFLDDKYTHEARHRTNELSGPAFISKLGVLEYENSVWRRVGFEGFTKSHAERAIRELKEFIAGGWLACPPVKDEAIWQRASGLSTVYSSDLKVRTLDILHVAFAMELLALEFWGFDRRQNSLAELAGFKVRL